MVSPKSRAAMRHSKHDDVNLAEVKAVLGRLQRISRKSYAASARTAEHDDAALPRSPQPAEPGAGEHGSFSPRVAVAYRILHVKPSRLVKTVLFAVPLLAGFAAIFVGIDRQPVPVKE